MKGHFCTPNFSLRPHLSDSPRLSTSQRTASISPLEREGKHLTIDEVEMRVCQVLKWPQQHFSALRKAAGLRDETALLTSDSLSALYRHTVICQMLSIAPSDCLRFFKIFLDGTKPF